jgi:steroid 5-alpha reductase family enzyme
VSGFPWAAFVTNLAPAAAAAFAVMLTFFALGTARGMHRLVDIAWGLAFTAVAVVTYASAAGHGDDTRRLLVASATALWGVRLAVHIAWRGRGHGEDPRYERMLAKAPGNHSLYALRTVYLLQGALVWIVSLPVQTAQFTPEPVGPLMFAGIAVWAAGLFFEAVGDLQLGRFKADPANRGRVMDRGLWSWTRHPNYFGDFLVWWGLFLMACGTWQAAVVSLVSPVVMSVLIKGSGKRLLESHMAQRPGYAAYMARTSGFLPRPPRSAGG